MKILKPFFKYVSVNVLGMIGLSCYILADTFFVSKAAGTEGLAALNVALPAYSLITALGLMMGIGGGTWYSVARARGGGKQSNVFAGMLVMGLAAGAVLALLGIFFAQNIATLLGANSETLRLSGDYLRVILCFSPFFILNNIIIAFVRNDSNPALCMIAMLVGSLSNVILDYIFMFPLGLGMFGAALATGIAPVIGIAITSLHFIRRKGELRFSLKKPALRKALLSLPAGVSTFITELSSGVVLLVFNLRILAISGNVGVAAYGIIANISLVCISVFTGIAQGVQPLVSSAYGKNEDADVKKLLLAALAFAILLAAVFYLVGIIFADGIISVFNSAGDTELAQIAKVGMRLYFIGFFFAAVNIPASAVLSATARTRRAFFISFIRGCLAIIPLAFILPLALGINGIWLAFVFAEALAALFFLLSMLFRRPRPQSDSKK